MNHEDRKAAKAAWTETKADAGIYALRFPDRVFVGATQRLGAARNRLEFTLRQGVERNPELVAAYGARPVLDLEVLERLDAELSPMARDRMLKERLADWRERLGAVEI